MRNELEHIEQIEQYLNGEMNTAERAAFEEAMQNNPSLAEQVQTQELLMQAAIRKAIKADIAKYGVSGAGGFNWTKWLGITTGVIIIAVISYFAITNTSPEDTKDTVAQTEVAQEIKNDSTNLQSNLKVTPEPTLMDSISSTDEINHEEKVGAAVNKQAKDYSYAEDTECGGVKTWVEPDRQITMINPKKGATIEGKDGTLIIIPRDAFVDDEGQLITEEVELELVEALKVSDMVAYNLTTMNDDQALQSGGMIYVQPTVDGKKVNINPDRPLYVEIPTDEFNPDMKAWNGEVDAEGNINWTNPKELEKYLTIVDFELLDFLPTGFEEAVEAGMPFKAYQKADKELVDSLYYSLGVNASSKSLNKPATCNTFDEVYHFSGELMPTIKNNFVINIRHQNETPVSNAFFEILNSGKSYFAETLNSESSVLLKDFPSGAFQIKVCQGKQITYFNNVDLKESTPSNFSLYLPDQNPEFGNRVVSFDRKTKHMPFSSINVRTFEINETNISFSNCTKCDLENAYSNPKFKDAESNASISLKLIDNNYNPLPNVTCDLRIENYPVFSSVSDKNGNVNFPFVISGLYQLKTCNGRQSSYIYDFKIKKGSNPITPIMPFTDPTQLTEMQWGKRVLCALDDDSAEQTLLSNEPSCFISPQSIQTIKSKQFANTFLSTKEFEQRLKVLHQMPDAQKLFDLYVNNLEKNLWEVDLMVAGKLSGEDKTFFTDFAAEKLTNVKDANIYQEQLSAYYSKKKQEYNDAAKAADAVYQKKSTADLKKYQSELNALKAEFNNLSYSASSNSSAITSDQMVSATSIKKFKPTIPSIKLPKKNVVTAPKTYSTTWYNTGWMNIDAYLKSINNGSKEVAIDAKKTGGRIYQCLNTLKAVIPLTLSGLIAKAKFPKKSHPDATKMSKTYAIGIRNDQGHLEYAEKFYNPYQSSNISLEWNNITAEELKKKLKVLDGADRLLDEIRQQEAFIQKQLEIKQKKEALKEEIAKTNEKVIQEKKKLEKERAFIASLEAVVNTCGVAFPIEAKKVSDLKDDVGSQSSTLSPVLQNVDGIFEIVDEMPEFPGGQGAMYDFLNQNIEYPQECIENNVQGKVYVQFVVDEEGKITNPTVIKSVHPLLDAEAIKIVNAMPKWKPGKNKGEAVKVRYTQPINFILD